jgi:hypothetical protein
MCRLICSVLAFFSLAGCNPYRKPQSFDPANEISASVDNVEVGPAIFAIPDSWSVREVLRFDAQGRPQTVYVDRVLDGRHVAFMLVEVQAEQPFWVGNAEVKQTSTVAHKDVVFDVTSTQAPSGDDTPGNFTLRAYTKEAGIYLYIYVSFFTPVDNLEAAVAYLDSITIANVNDEGGNEDKSLY